MLRLTNLAACLVFYFLRVKNLTLAWYLNNVYVLVLSYQWSWAEVGGIIGTTEVCGIIGTTEVLHSSLLFMNRLTQSQSLFFSCSCSRRKSMWIPTRNLAQCVIQKRITLQDEYYTILYRSLRRSKGFRTNFEPPSGPKFYAPCFNALGKWAMYISIILSGT